MRQKQWVEQRFHWLLSPEVSLLLPSDARHCCLLRDFDTSRVRSLWRSKMDSYLLQWGAPQALLSKATGVQELYARNLLSFLFCLCAFQALTWWAWICVLVVCLGIHPIIYCEEYLEWSSTWHWCAINLQSSFYELLQVRRVPEMLPGSSWNTTSSSSKECRL